MTHKNMRLTHDLVARVKELAGQVTTLAMPEGRRHAGDSDYNAIVEKMMSELPEGEAPHIFAYGSLIWKPDFEFTDRQCARAFGFHRSFCLGWDRFFRGSVERPGLMLALDFGGSCNGIAFRLPEGKIEENLHRLARREMRLIPHPFPPRWLKIEGERGPVRALTFVMDRRSASYVGGLSMEETADVLARAFGTWGSMAEYLHNTVTHLEESGIRDPHLWRLQEMVAERIEAECEAANS